MTLETFSVMSAVVASDAVGLGPSQGRARGLLASALAVARPIAARVW